MQEREELRALKREIKMSRERKVKKKKPYLTFSPTVSLTA
jgi:hypothetical protein